MPDAGIQSFGDYAICAPNIIFVLLIMKVHQNSGEAMFMYYFFGTYHLLKHYYRSTPSNIILQRVHATMNIFGLGGLSLRITIF
jgi:hypothetical protein